MTFAFRLIAIVLAFGGVSCRTAQPAPRPPIIQPGAPGETSRVISAGNAVDLSHVQHTGADERFMQGMVGHHLQALDMTALLATRTASDQMRKLAQRIEVSQSDEITMMRRWLEVRGLAVPGDHAHHMGGPLMPGMLTGEEIDRLATVKGLEFDRLFLEFMIKHHEGALVMVKALFSTPRAGQESEIFAFASDVDADQRMEINRMGIMLRELQK